MKSSIKYIAALLLASFLVGCSEDFLDLKPLGRPSTESFYTDFESLDYTATSAYGMLCSRDVYDIMYSIGFQSASDDSEVGGENTSDWPEFQVIDRFTHTTKEARIHRFYAYVYKGIRMTNEFLTRVDEIREIENAKIKSPAEHDATNALIDLRIAEMHYLQAFYHFTLVQVYGGVPIMDVLGGGEEQSMARSSIAEVLHFIESELEAAIPDLKEKSELDLNQGRATKGAARALLAKAYLYESSYAKNYGGDSRFADCETKYDLALKYAEDVILSEEYLLVGENGERFPSWNSSTGLPVGGFRWMFTLDGDNCDGSVFEIQSLNDGAEWTRSRGNYMTVYTTVRFCYASDGTPGQSAGGWSFNLPTKYLVAAFGNKDTRETGLNSSPVDEDLDPRFATTVGRAGDLVKVGSEWFEMDFQNLPTETISRKYECSYDEYWGSMYDFHGGPINIRLIRFADVVLMAAEAAYEEGDMGEALAYVNRVRTRARASGDTGYPEDLSTLSFEDIVHERRLELAMESSRFFDLVRWNLTEQFIKGTTLASMGEGFIIDFESGKHEFLPIPAVIMQKNSALEQYQAWK